ncbi:hypothetical protein Tco_0004376 [Tanacetum coccineum]
MSWSRLFLLSRWHLRTLRGNTIDSKDPKTEERHIVPVGSFGITDMVRNRKDSSSQAARSNSKRKNVAPTPQSRMTRQQMVMPSSKADKGKASCLDNMEVEKLCDLHDKSYTRQVVLDNEFNTRTKEFLKAKCEEAMKDFEKNPLVTQLRDKIKSIESQLEEHQADYGRLVLESIKFHGSRGWGSSKHELRVEG